MWWALATAWAAPPVDLRPVAAPWDTPQRWAAHQATKGLDDDPLACRPLWADHALVCLRQVDGSGLRWVTASDVAGWGTTLDALFAAVTTDAKARLSELETVPVEGLGSYRRLVSGEGWAVAVALHADELVAELGPDLRVALPAGTVALAWPAGSSELDKAMAVGVVELAEEQPGEVSRTVFRWDGEALIPFAEAKAPVATEAGAAHGQDQGKKKPHR